MLDITYGSVRSGIEAATQAWHPLGMCFTWKAGINRAQVLEARADGKKINIEGWSQ